MATTQEIAEARKRLEERWDSEGCCDSCGLLVTPNDADIIDTGTRSDEKKEKEENEQHKKRRMGCNVHHLAS